MKRNLMTDDQIRSYYDNQRITPSDEVWKLLSTELNQAAQSKIKKIIIFRSTAAFCILTISCILIFLWQKNIGHEHTDTLISDQKVNSQKQESIQPITTDSPENHSLISQIQNNNKSDKTSLIQKNPAISTSFATNQDVEHVVVFVTDKSEVKSEDGNIQNENKSSFSVSAPSEIGIAFDVLQEENTLIFSNSESKEIKSKLKQSRIDPYALLAEAEAAEKPGFLGRTFKNLQEYSETIIASVNDRNTLK